MSIGMYIASFYDLKIENSSSSSELFSINDLKKFENYADLISNLKVNMGIDIKEIDPTEKIFVFPEESEENFSVKRDKDDGTINKYTTKPFIYYVDIFSWKNFYEKFSELLKNINAPFELWLIWEDKYEANDLKTFELHSIDPLTLERVFGLNEYLDPIVGIYE